MHRENLTEDIEAFLARQNQENDVLAFNAPLEFSCLVMLQPVGVRGMFKLDEAGMEVRSGDRWYQFAWDDVFRLRMNPHSVKVFLRDQPAVTINGAVRAAILGLFYQMEHE